MRLQPFQRHEEGVMKEDEPGDALPETTPGSGKSILCFGIEK
jgi:hypothetical protein